ncbi:hypothetical protein KC343_g10028 [Hortaea werneckii]|uniref:Mediator of RNA polymerase II transcription subunit 11 n=1 Tax=Hortaea werneckii TaxID=91943 RepID=A0A3M7C8V2_HORWE
MASEEITPADRIRELNSINEDLTSVLQHAGESIKVLSPAGSEDADSLEARKAQFDGKAKDVFVALQSATARLRRQAYALEEAGIIAAQAPTLSSGGPQQPRPQGAAPGGKQAEPERITNGGLGNLDVGWLNSRGNKVGAEKEAELLDEAKDLAQRELDQAT